MTDFPRKAGIRRQPAKARQFTSSGFQMLWGALTSKPR